MPSSKWLQASETVEIVIKHYFRPGAEQFRAMIFRAMPDLLSQRKFKAGRDAGNFANMKEQHLAIRSGSAGQNVGRLMKGCKICLWDLANHTFAGMVSFDSSPENLRSVLLFRTAMAMPFSAPQVPQSFLPRVIPV